MSKPPLQISLKIFGPIFNENFTIIWIWLSLDSTLSSIKTFKHKHKWTTKKCVEIISYYILEKFFIKNYEITKTRYRFLDFFRLQFLVKNIVCYYYYVIIEIFNVDSSRRAMRVGGGCNLSCFKIKNRHPVSKLCISFKIWNRFFKVLN